MKPILFNTAMVRAILDGRKTVTRRVVKMDKADAVLSSPVRMENPDIPDDRFINCLCTAPCEIGDILYVRETWAYGYVDTTDFECRCNECFFEELKAGTQKDSFLMPRYFYRTENLDGLNVRWRPSIHMPKEAARLFLRVTAVRVERLKEIDATGIRQEGLTTGAAHCGDMEIAQQEFALLWNSTIKPAYRARYGWDANPWVWVIEFEQISKEVALEGDGDDK